MRLTKLALMTLDNNSKSKLSYSTMSLMPEAVLIPYLEVIPLSIFFSSLLN